MLFDASIANKVAVASLTFQVEFVVKLMLTSWGDYMRRGCCGTKVSYLADP